LEAFLGVFGEAGASLLAHMEVRWSEIEALGQRAKRILERPNRTL
jgi:hypothetical protein